MSIFTAPYPRLEIRLDRSGGKGKMLVTLQPIPRGELFARIDDYRDLDRPTYQTIQVGADRHIEEHGVISFLNHSCDPNVMIDTHEMGCRALKDIPAGSELSFFYPSTEWVMDRPFRCLCGAADCVGWVSGARDLAAETVDAFSAEHPSRPFSPHVRALLAERVALT